ncbi:hypothetical protein, partial [Pseudomonas aeruginosa]|uniref:hypothetical protein n=1 Tax=Pseudomonas aeruginosa TaxID=287 RepID=UPI0024BEBDD8
DEEDEFVEVVVEGGWVAEGIGDGGEIVVGEEEVVVGEGKEVGGGEGMGVEGGGVGEVVERLKM